MIFVLPVLSTIITTAIGTTGTVFVAKAVLDSKRKNEAEIKRREREAFAYGERQGNIETAKKFEKQYKEQLESFEKRFKEQMDKDEANVIATWALGIYVAGLDEIQKEELDVIYRKVGDPNSGIVNPDLRDKFIEIYNSNPRFTEIEVKYLDVVETEFLEELKEYVHQIIISDQEVSEPERYFLKYEWYPYLKSRGIKVEDELNIGYQDAGYQNNSYEQGTGSQQQSAVQGQETQLTENDEFNMLMKAATEGDTTAMFNLGKAFEYGQLGKAKDYLVARRWYKNAAKAGLIVAQYKLEDIERLIKKEKERKELKEMFRVDEAEAGQLYNEGWRYEHGDGVPEDIEYAKELYRRAAIKGSQPAKSRLNFLTSIS